MTQLALVKFFLLLKTEFRFKVQCQHNDTQHNIILSISVVLLTVVMLSAMFCVVILGVFLLSVVFCTVNLCVFIFRIESLRKLLANVLFTLYR
jgi:hypothetical protein